MNGSVVRWIGNLINLSRMDKMKYYLIFYILLLVLLIFWDYKLLNIWYITQLFNDIYMYLINFKVIYLINLIKKLTYFTKEVLVIFLRKYIWKLKFAIRKMSDLNINFNLLWYVIDFTF